MSMCWGDAEQSSKPREGPGYPKPQALTFASPGKEHNPGIDWGSLGSTNQKRNKKKKTLGGYLSPLPQPPAPAVANAVPAALNLNLHDHLKAQKKLARNNLQISDSSYAKWK